MTRKTTPALLAAALTLALSFASGSALAKCWKCSGSTISSTSTDYWDESGIINSSCGAGGAWQTPQWVPKPGEKCDYKYVACDRETVLSDSKCNTNSNMRSNTTMMYGTSMKVVPKGAHCDSMKIGGLCVNYYQQNY